MRLFCGLEEATWGNASFKLTLYGWVVSVSFASLDVVCDELYGMMVCSSFLISVCMFIVSKATVVVHAGGTIWLNPFATVLFI